MAKSMTGYGHFEAEGDSLKITVEIKSVNHRYCDLNIKLPKKLNRFEAFLRNILKKYTERGKIDVFIGYEDFSERQAVVRYHEGIARGFYEGLQQIGEDFGLQTDASPSVLARFPEVFTLEEAVINEDEIKELLEKAAIGAAELFCKAREAEGEHLTKDIFGKLEEISGFVSYIEERSPKLLAEYRDKIMNKVNEMLGDKKIDEAILATELTIYADKICVDEETVRLHSHIQNMKQTLQQEGTVGRKLDFIAQEMNREANTILSKANDIEISNVAIDLKTVIEKIREQIQNIE